jgi:hypothetical protein
MSPVTGTSAANIAEEAIAQMGNISFLFMVWFGVVMSEMM